MALVLRVVHSFYNLLVTLSIKRTKEVVAKENAPSEREAILPPDSTHQEKRHRNQNIEIKTFSLLFLSTGNIFIELQKLSLSVVSLASAF